MADNRSISQRQTGFFATAVLYTVVVLAILIVVNYLAFRFNRSVDLTSNRIFSLSQETAKIVGKVKEDAKIWYFDLPENFSQARGILDRYKDLNPNIHLEYVDYLQNPMKKAEYGVHREGTAIVEYGNRREEVKSLDEQGITAAFLKLSKVIRRVCFVTGGKERSIDEREGDGLSAFKSWLDRDNYRPEAISLLENPVVPDDCKVVVVAGPRVDYPANEVNALKTYVETKGGRVLFLLDPPLDVRSEHIPENKELAGLLASWGITLDNDVVIEATRFMQVFGPLRVPVSHFENHPIVNDLKGSIVLLPITRSMQIKNAGKSTVTALFTTTANAVAKTDLSSAVIDFADPKNAKGPFTLGAAATYDTGKPDEAGRLVVIGTSAFLSNNESSQALNRDLAINTVNWLSSDEDLISIHQKEPEDRKLNPASISPIWIFDLFVFPLLIIGGGIMVYFARR